MPTIEDILQVMTGISIYVVVFFALLLTNL